MLRRAILVADQHPRFLGLLGIGVLLMAIVVIGVFADMASAFAGLTGMVAAGAGAWLYERGSTAPRRRAERAAKTRRIERDLDL